MKLSVIAFSIALLFASTSCKRTFVCGCTVYQNISGVDTSIHISSQRFIMYKANATDYCEGEFTDSLNRHYSVNNTECFVNGVGM